MTLIEIDERLLALWRSSGSDLRRFAAACPEAGFGIAMGHKSVTLFHLESGLPTSLVRHVNLVSKAHGEGARLLERDVREVLGRLPTLKELQGTYARSSVQRAGQAVEFEFDRFIGECEADGDTIVDAKAKAAKARLANRLSDQEGLELRNRQAAIRDRFRQRDRIRKARVNRAFLAARIFATPQMKKLVFFLAAGAAVLTGAGVVTALIGAGMVVAALPDRRDAQRVRQAANAERNSDQALLVEEVRNAGRAFFARRAAFIRKSQEEARRAQKMRIQMINSRRRRGTAADSTVATTRVRAVRKPTRNRNGPER
ncbi:hypothetical protein [Bosea sp. PAMC 26642]|uniref:hypothetical protein n=1 Tax=Bosea sp. (strain PAMC 26642) TaxID=1792307 RepID=UPI0007704600|nr:hypothetical protein [Bosea sp. PAMC 26642]AMJ61599.1 hypothetical protein AXW83_15945 [Bosea sp. PAMC 26642]